MKTPGPELTGIAQQRIAFTVQAFYIGGITDDGIDFLIERSVLKQRGQAGVLIDDVLQGLVVIVPALKKSGSATTPTLLRPLLNGISQYQTS